MDDWICSRLMWMQPTTFSVLAVSSSLFARARPVSSSCHSPTLLPSFSLTSFGFSRHTAWLRSHVPTKRPTSAISASTASSASSSRRGGIRSVTPLNRCSPASSRAASRSVSGCRRGSAVTVLTTARRLSSHLFLLSATGGFTTSVRLTTRIRCTLFSRSTARYTSGSSAASSSSRIASSSCSMSADSSRSLRRNATSQVPSARLARSTSAACTSSFSVWMKAGSPTHRRLPSASSASCILCSSAAKASGV